MTQGLVTILKNNVVVMKIVAGSDGMNAGKVARAIRKLGRVPTFEEALDLARRNGFGSSGLVVIDPTRAISEFDGPLGKLYRSTFNQPRFNPRWERGTTSCFRLITTIVAS